MSKLTNQLEYERNKYAAYDKEAKEAEKRVAAAEKELSVGGSHIFGGAASVFFVP